MPRAIASLLAVSVVAIAVTVPVQAQPGSGLDDTTAAEVLPLLVDADESAKIAAMAPEARARLAAERMAQLPAWQRELTVRRVLHAKAHLAEKGTLVTARTVALLTLGPPVRIHVEPSRAWRGADVRRIEVADVAAELERGSKAAAGEPASAPERPVLRLEGERPSEAWVYPLPARPGFKRVLWFVDEDKDGTLRLASDEVIPAADVVSRTPVTVPPGDLFAQLGYGEPFEALPSVAHDDLPLKALTAFFQGVDGRTFSRIVVAVDPSDIELNLEVPPADFQTSADAWLRVEQSGQPIFQREIPAGTGGLAHLGGHWGADFSLPLLPGEYDWTAVVVDASGRGGRETGTLTVPALTGEIALSSVVLGSAVTIEGKQGLPKPKPKDGGEPAPFQVGTYEVRPRTPAVFKRGETLAVVVQVYNAASASVDFDVYMNGVLQGTVETVELKALPATEIQLIDVLEQWPDAAYKIVVVATDEAKNKVSQEVAFRVKG